MEGVPAPQGRQLGPCIALNEETLAMMLRQEASLDRSIDGKVRILMRLRKDFPKLPVAHPGEDDGARIETTEKILADDIMPEHLQRVETAGGEEGNRTGKNKSKGKSQKAKPAK